MFSQPNPVIVQIRRELCGQLPDEWLEEVVSILEYQLTYQTLDELAINDLLKLRLGSGASPTLKQSLAQSLPPVVQRVDVSLELPQTFRLPCKESSLRDSMALLAFRQKYRLQAQLEFAELAFRRVIA